MATIEHDGLLIIFLDYLSPRQQYRFATMVYPGLQRIIIKDQRQPTTFEKRIFEIYNSGPPRSWWAKLVGRLS